MSDKYRLRLIEVIEAYVQVLHCVKPQGDYKEQIRTSMCIDKFNQEIKSLLNEGEVVDG